MPWDAETAGWDERDAPEVVSPVRVRVQRREREREREDEQTKGAHGRVTASDSAAAVFRAKRRHPRMTSATDVTRKTRKA